MTMPTSFPTSFDVLAAIAVLVLIAMALTRKWGD
jgi:hypothetical protein